ncbi:MAG: hypothetical protein ACREJO_11370 [Phycisphaerales bacterium]
MKDATQVRNITQAMMVFANSNKDVFPLPSVLDADNATIAADRTGADAKNTQSNILSVLVYNNFISTELLVSPQEVSSSIKVCDTYASTNPSVAANPAKALWDPSLSVDFTSTKPNTPGHTSYAMMAPDDVRRAAGKYGNTFSATEPLIGNRGPEITGLRADGSPILNNPGTNTFLIHGSRRTWEGNIAYNDGHVNTETRYDPVEVTYKNAAGKNITDNLFFDEPDDPSGLNAFLTVFPKAGTTKAEFKRIWD